MTDEEKQKRLFLSILALDSYSRGPNPRLENFNPITIGTANFVKAAQPNDVGFYAVEYTWNNKTVISYRGTDFNNGLASDLINGWPSFFGFSAGEQAKLAVNFYRETANRINGGMPADPRSGNVILTGHSLGGGLAGLVAGVTVTVHLIILFHATIT